MAAQGPACGRDRHARSNGAGPLPFPGSGRYGPTRAALRREADRRGIFLADEVMAYLLTRFPRDLKYLMTVLDRLDEFAMARGRAVTVPLLRAMLAEEGLPAIPETS